MLVLTRKPSQVVEINLREGVDPNTPIGELFAQGPIEVTVTAVSGDQAKLGIRADKRFLILREELCPPEPEDVY